MKWRDRTRRVFDVDGLTVSEVEFEIEDRPGWYLGYMIGKEDGKTALTVTAHEAVHDYRVQFDDATGAR